MIVSNVLLLCLGLSFFLSVVLSLWWIKRARRAGMVGRDMHKKDMRKVAEIGGLPVMVAFLIGVFIYVGIRTFLFSKTDFNLEIIAGVLTVLLLGLVGLVDDMLGWKIGLRQWQKPILCLFAALPIMMINSGVSTMYFPGLGDVNLGIAYSLVVIPLIISASANAFNMVAGYNGLEAGLGVIILFGIGFIVWVVQGLGIYAMLGAIMMAALAGFLFFNRYPAKIFPGDTLTYTVGGLIGVIAILGNAEKVLLILFVPYVIQFFIKSRHGWQRQSFGQIDEKGWMKRPSRIDALEHLAVRALYMFKRKVSERDVVYSLYFFEMVFVGVVVLAQF